tara:strand:- start:303 stop:1163 length:861 start_codon:yes stop_codon:yes gene_type:complete
MPELPEVEIIKQSLEKSVQSKIISKVLIKNRNLRFKTNKNLSQILEGKKILKISRKSKYLIIHFAQNNYLIIHFGMSGTLHLVKKNNLNRTNLSFYSSRDLPKKHNHVTIIFNNFKLIYNDPRRFGFFKFFKSKKLILDYLSNLGPEPIEKKFNLIYLKKKFCNKKKNIKNILLDQKYVSGIGNIYANEILYCAKINPFNKGKNLTDKDILKIISCSKDIILKAIKKGGSTIRNFKNSKGKKGSFQDNFKVYNRANKKCFSKKCKGKILKFFASNRSTFFCKYCQK